MNTDHWTAADDEPICYRLTEAGRKALRESAAPRDQVLDLAAWLRRTHRFDLAELARVTGYHQATLSRALSGNVPGVSMALVEAVRREGEHLQPRPPATHGPRGTRDHRGREMAAELARILKRLGRYNVSELARRTGRNKRVVSRALNGGGCSEALAEQLAAAAGIDEAYLYPDDGRVPDSLRDLVA